MFNTFEPERPQRAVGADRCAFGMPFVQATISADGRLKATIGAAGQKTLVGEQRWVDLFKAAGLPAVLEPKMPLWLRCHVPLCVAFESVSVAGMRRGGGASWGESSRIALGVRASFRLIEELGYSPYPRGIRLIARSPSPVTAAMLWSMSRLKSFRELLATGEAECRALVDAMLVSARSTTPNDDLLRITAMKPAPRSER